jgi:hypothetical protein
MNLIVEASLIHSLADPAERVQSPLTALTLIKEMPDGLFDEFVATLIPSARQFLLTLLSQIGW